MRCQFHIDRQVVSPVEASHGSQVPARMESGKAAFRRPEYSQRPTPNDQKRNATFSRTASIDGKLRIFRPRVRILESINRASTLFSAVETSRAFLASNLDSQYFFELLAAISETEWRGEFLFLSFFCNSLLMMQSHHVLLS
jgi:hypothetical protein